MSSSEQMSLADHVAKTIESGEFQLPALPAILHKLQMELAGDEADARRIARLVGQEPAVAASLLRAANSALFGGLTPISHMNQAIARLGMKRVQAIVTAIVAHGQFAAQIDWAETMVQRLWDHAVASAACARRLAEREGVDTEQAFMAGLLHGIGRLVVLKALDDLGSKDPNLELTETAVDEIVETLQGDIGYRTLKSWNLAEELCLSTRLDEIPDEVAKALMVRIVAASDLVAKKLGMHPKPDESISLLDQETIEGLELGDVELAGLLVKLEDDIESIRGCL